LGHSVVAAEVGGAGPRSPPNFILSKPKILIVLMVVF
jgi:hypothetical protein